MKVLIRGLSEDVTEEMLREKLEPYAKVLSLEMMREGDPRHPWAWVDLAIDYMQAWRLMRQFDKQYFAGGMMHWYIPAHQDNMLTLPTKRSR
jgi:hypothetical protein